MSAELCYQWSYLRPAIRFRGLFDFLSHLPPLLGRDPRQHLVRLGRPPHALALVPGPLETHKSRQCRGAGAGRSSVYDVTYPRSDSFPTRSFFFPSFHPIYCLCPTPPARPFTTQIRGYIAGNSPPSPLRLGFDFLGYKTKYIPTMSRSIRHSSTV